MSRRTMQRQKHSQGETTLSNSPTAPSPFTRKPNRHGQKGFMAATCLASLLMLVWIFDLWESRHLVASARRPKQLLRTPQHGSSSSSSSPQKMILTLRDYPVWKPVPSADIAKMDILQELYHGRYKLDDCNECFVEFPIPSHIQASNASEFCVVTKMGQKGHEMPNQDRTLLAYGSDWFLAGLFDGHGDRGEVASEIAQSEILLPIVRSRMEQSRQSVLKKAFLDADNGPIMDISHAGTTAMAILQVGSTIDLASVGDSTAVVVQWFGIEDSDGSNKSEPSWLDSLLFGFESTSFESEANIAYKIVLQNTKHKPGDPEEKRRIESNGGVVSPVGPGESSRVIYLQKDPITGMTVQVGLAMSRSIGDGEAKQQNLVIADPALASVDLKNYVDNDRSKGFFTLLASDGVFDMMSLDEVIMTIGKTLFEETTTIASNLDATCRQIIEESSDRWGMRTMQQYRDDISLTVKRIFID